MHLQHLRVKSVLLDDNRPRFRGAVFFTNSTADAAVRLYFDVCTLVRDLEGLRANRTLLDADLAVLAVTSHAYVPAQLGDAHVNEMAGRMREK